MIGFLSSIVVLDEIFFYILSRCHTFLVTQYFNPFFRFPNNTQRLVLYKEKNMLLTESELCRRNAEYFPQPERRQKVKKSMGAIKQVLGERKRERFSKIALMRESGEEISG